MRRIFVGDVHGCRAELETLLAAVDFQRGRDVLHSVGDLVNKGPDSAGVVALMMALQAVAVIGNHDLAWLEAGLVTDPEQARWLSALPVVRVFDDLILVHGGLHPAWTESRLEALEGADVDYAVNVRHCDAEGRRPALDWPPPGPPFVPWYDFYRGDKRVVFGHWARQGLLITDRAIGLDTGCVYGHQLTAWVAEEERIVQVPGLGA